MVMIAQMATFSVAGPATQKRVPQTSGRTQFTSSVLVELRAAPDTLLSARQDERAEFPDGGTSLGARVQLDPP